jgi:hypothetical protein
MPRPDEKIAEIGDYTVFRKSDSREYEIVGPAVSQSPLAYTMIRVSPIMLDKLRSAVLLDVGRNKSK